MTNPEDDTSTSGGRQEAGRFVERVLFVALVIALALLAWSWRHALLLVFASILVASGLQGLAAPIRRRLPVGEGVSVGIAGVIIVGVIAGIGWLIGAQLNAQVSQLSQTLPDALHSLKQRLSQTALGSEILDQTRSGLTGDGVVSMLATRLGKFGTTFSSGALDALIVVIAAIFLAIKPRRYRDGLLVLAPKSQRDHLRQALDASGAGLKLWLVATLFSMVAMSLLVGLSMWALGVPAPMALGLLAGIAQFVPLIGPIAASIPGILLALVISPATAVWATLIYFATTTLEADLLQPLIQEQAVETPPVLTLYAIIALGLLFGPLGVLLAVPLTVVAMIFIVIFYVRGRLGEDVAIPGQDPGGGKRDARTRRKTRQLDCPPQRRPARRRPIRVEAAARHGRGRWSAYIAPDTRDLAGRTGAI